MPIKARNMRTGRHMDRQVSELQQWLPDELTDMDGYSYTEVVRFAIDHLHTELAAKRRNQTEKEPTR